jgi:SNF2 family DNA or RNA helicase
MKSLTLDDFREAQHIIREFAYRVLKCAIFADMGLGKTGAIIALIVDLFNALETNCVLIIAPLRVARKTWPDEFQLWTHSRWLSYEVLWKAKAGSTTPSKNAQRRLQHCERKIKALHDKFEDLVLSPKWETAKGKGQASKIKREIFEAKMALKWGRASATRPADVHIVNRENVYWLVLFWGRYWPYDTVIYDESSDLKNGKKVKRWKAMRRIMGLVKRFIELTGTPAPKGLMDLWGQIYPLDGGERLGRSITEYRKEYFTVDYSGYVWTARPGALEKVTALISDICITLRAKDFMDLPPTIYNQIPVTLSESEFEQYQTLKDEYMVELDDGAEIEAASAGVLSGKLLQLASGLVYDSEKKVHWFHSRKIEALKDYIAERQGHNVLVAYYFDHDLKALRKAFPKTPVFGDDDSLVDQWNSGDLKMMFVHPQSAGHGLNIQFGGRRLIWYGPIPTQDLELYQQLNDRLGGARSFGLGSAFIDHLVAADTHDEYVMNRLDIKRLEQEGVKERTNLTVSRNS